MIMSYIQLTIYIKVQKLESGRGETSYSKRLPLAVFQPRLSTEKDVSGFQATCSPKIQDQNSQPKRPQASSPGALTQAQVPPSRQTFPGTST